MIVGRKDGLGEPGNDLNEVVVNRDLSSIVVAEKVRCEPGVENAGSN